MIKTLLLLASVVLGQPGPGSFVLDRFGGLNDSDSPAVIPQHQAQDALNVEGNLQGTAIIKRSGFSEVQDLTYTTSAVDGSFFFRADNGDELTVVCHDRVCAKSTNGGAFANFLTTASASATRWSFVTVDGDLYGANDQRDAVLKYDGTSLTHPSEIPAGSLLELTEDRLVVADTSANPGRLAYSKSADFSEFTTGVNPADPWTDDMGAPGDKITGLKYYSGVLHVFKALSITLCVPDDQYTTDCELLTDQLGTTDPTSIVATPDGLYFRGSDKNFWRISGGQLEKASEAIPTLVQSASSGKNQSNSQTTQTDWDAGTETPAATVWDTSTSPGSIFPSSVTLTDTSAADFAAGTLTNVSTISTSGAATIYQNGNAVFVNAGAETDSTTNWVKSGGLNWAQGTAECASGLYGSKCWVATGGSEGPGGCPKTLTVRILDSSDTTLQTNTYSITDGLAATAASIDTSALAYPMIKVQFQTADSDATTFIHTSSVIVRPSAVAFKYADETTGSVCVAEYDFDETVSLNATGNIVSQIFDAAVSSYPTWGTFSATISSDSNSGLTFQVQASTANDGGGFETLVSQTLSSKIGAAQYQYIRYKGNFTLNAATNTPAAISDVSLIAATTGQYATQCIQACSDISAAGVVACSETLGGNGSLTYYTRSAATCGALTGSWTAQTNNAAFAASANVAMQIRFDSVLGSATDQAQVDACTLYWSCGSVAPPSWGVYDSIKNAIFWTYAVNNSATNNRLLKYDLNLREWFPWDIQANAPSIISNTLYFGGASTGTWYRYGNVEADNASAINAYWKSKDLSGNPFVERTMKNVSLIAANEGTGSLTVTYTYGRNTSGSYSVSLSTTSGIPYVRKGYNLPAASPHSFFNVQVGNNAASQPFEVLGLKMDYIEQPWRPYTP